jgi:sugar phosphate isomerase/epimerase
MTTTQKKPLSLQLYTVRKEIEKDLPGTIARVADIGYTSVELFRFPDRAPELAAALHNAGLTAPTAHARLIDKDQHAIFAAAKEIGVETVIDPHIEDSRWASQEGIEGIARDLNETAKLAADYGLRIGYHNHAFEFENRVGGRSAYEGVVDLLDPAIALEVDVYWAIVGGEDAIPLLTRLGDRVRFLHIKDGPVSKVDTDQVAVGSGSLATWDILAAVPSLELGVVELDDFTGDVFDAVRDSYTYLSAGDPR